jgi:GT2 family glycosyltransferase
MKYIDRRICLVGNGDITDTTLGERVDSHDLVVRFNNFILSEARGRKTTHFASTFHKDIAAVPHSPELSGLTVAFVGGLGKGPVYEAWRTRIDEDWSHPYAELARALGSGPSAGLVALAWLLTQRPAEVALVGFSFCQDLARGGNHSAGDIASKERLYHNWVGEIRVFRELARTSPVPVTVLDDPVKLQREVQRASDSLAVIIPTFDRPLLLANRSLPSVAAQTRRPDIVIVVDDAPWRTRRVNQEIVASWRLPGTQVVYLENWRTSGAAGGWNTALHHLHRVRSGCWVALLDDDDEWAPTYLQKCLDKGIRDGADVVVAGLLRHEGPGAPHAHTIPKTTFRQEDFLVGNPHWQGSNTFARLNALLGAGGFDESFESTNDRDLGLRLLDLPWVRWSFVDEHLVHHHAEPGTERLSRRGSPRKEAGLKAFYAKYRGRMTEALSEKFFTRSREIFDLPEHRLIESAPASVQSPSKARAESRVRELLVGTISSPDVGVTRGFLRGLRELSASAPETRIELVVFNNIPEETTRRSFRSEIDAFGADSGVRCHVTDGPDGRRASIAEARTRLQVACYRALGGRVMPVWLLDDDVRFDIPTDMGDRIDWEHRPDHLAWIEQLGRTGADVVIGSVTGEPPLPFASTVRVQIVDLLHNIEWMSGLAPSDKKVGPITYSHPGLDKLFPTRHAENMALRRRYRDYYYDLSRVDTGQLERPFWYEPRKVGATVGDAFREMVGALEGIFAGRQVFRPLVWTPVSPARSLLPGFSRGPNTLVFRPECLVQLPNAAPRLAGEDTRRSDMNWSLLGHHVEGWHVVTAPFPVRQDRAAVDAARGLDHRTLILDVRGYAVFSALSDVLLERRAERQARGAIRHGLDLLDLTAEELTRAVRRTEKYLGERLVAWETSHLRIEALAWALESYLFINRERDRQRWHFWLDDPSFTPELDCLSAFVRRLRREFEPPAETVTRGALDFDRADLTRFFTHLRADVERFRSRSSGEEVDHGTR